MGVNRKGRRMIEVRAIRAIHEMIGVAKREFPEDHESAIRLMAHALASYIITNAETCDEGCPIICPTAFAGCMTGVVQYAFEVRDTAAEMTEEPNAYH